MALPTLHSQSTAKIPPTSSQRDEQQQSIHVTRTFERPQTANSITAQSRYNSARSKLISPISGVLSDEVVRTEEEKQEKSNRLQRRRKHLSSLLEEENNKYQNELASMRHSIRESMPPFRIGAESIYSAREKEQSTTATAEKLDKAWTINDHSLNTNKPLDIEHLSLKQDANDDNGGEDNNDDDHYRDYESSLRLDEPEKLHKDKRTSRIQQLKTIIQQQMIELKQKEEESEKLKQEEDNLLKQQIGLDQYEEERKQMESRFIQKNDEGRQLLRQHKAKFHKRTKEIQELLELDIKILTYVAEVDTGIYSNEDHQLKRNVLLTLKQFQQQMKLEKDKEQEVDGMFQEEITKQLVRREQEWNHEKESRAKTIQQILDRRQEQVMARLQEIKCQQQYIYERRKILLADMEQARKFDVIEKQKQVKEREEEKRDTFKPTWILRQEQPQPHLDSEKQETITDEVPDKKLTQTPKETSTTTSAEPKFYGRRRINWN